ncbi:MAG: hypothetical protein U0547_05760 [Dehalococcoidia bacterium]
MRDTAGIEGDGATMRRALATPKPAYGRRTPSSALVAELMLEAALRREESRGAHFAPTFPRSTTPTGIEGRCSAVQIDPRPWGAIERAVRLALEEDRANCTATLATVAESLTGEAIFLAKEPGVFAGWP